MTHHFLQSGNSHLPERASGEASAGRLRVLLIAEDANPELASVPLVGWSQAHAIGKITDAHLVTQVRNRAAIIRAGYREGQDFTVLDTEKIAKPMWQLGNFIRGGETKGWTTTAALASLSYYYFEWLLWRRFGARIRGGEFDLVHRLVPLTPTTPSLIAKKCRRAGVPFVLGPLNGGLPWPSGFDGVRRAEKEWLSYIRDAYKMMPGYRSMRREAAVILVGSEETLRQIPSRYQKKCIYLPENGVNPERFKLARVRRTTRPLKLIFVGRLVPYKGADMVLEAAAGLMRKGEVRLEIVGEGPQEPELRAMIQRLGIQEFTSMSGWIPHEQVQSRLVEADLFCFPSIREFGGGVVLEAMAVGLVPMVVRYGGPAELATPETGFFVELAKREQIIEQLRTKLAELVAHPEEIDRRSRAARDRVMTEFTWDAKAKKVLDVYKDVLARRGN